MANLVDIQVIAHETYQRMMAQKHYPEGALLRCKSCGKRGKATTLQVANYLAYGWPICCHKTMEHRRRGVINYDHS